MTVKRALRVIAAVLLVATLLPSVACMGKIQQAAQRQQESNDLKQIALTYVMYCDDHKGKGPDTADDFTKWAQQKAPEATIVLNNLKSGKYVFYMGATITNLPQGMANTVVGYESNVPTAGGPVVMVDGSTRIMTAAEFAAATKPAGAKLSK